VPKNGRITSRLAAIVLAVSAVGSGLAEATLIWDGAASQGTGVFKIVSSNCASPGSVSAASDTTWGTVWRYNKPSGSDRCESHGIAVNGSGYTFQNGSTYYLGWRSRLTSTADNNANFQWKAYPTEGSLQNWPIVLKIISNRITMIQRQPGNDVRTVWSAPVSVNQWNHYVLYIGVSSGTTSGWVELWHNGTKQTLSNGSQRWSCRTFDSEHVCPKWGTYGASTSSISNYVHGLKVGTTYADVGPGGGTSPTPTPAPTATPVPGATPTPTPTVPTGGGFSGYYRIMGQQSGRALVVQSAATGNSASVIVWDYNDNTSDNDEWEVRSIGSGYHRIIARHSGKDMTVASASTANGANIFQYTYGGTATNDEWQIVDSGGGYFEIRNRNSGKNAQAMGTANSSAVQQQTDDDGSDQRWQFVSIP
jgi:hypothetical protein